MCGIKDCLSRRPSSHSNIMLWAACCLAFFGFLRVSKFTVPCHGTCDPGTHLSLDDIFFDNGDKPCPITVFIKQSKTDPFRKGVTLYLGATNHPVCPVTDALPYLALRSSHPGPLFLTKEGKGLAHQSFSTLLDVILADLRLQPHDYNANSFRIGAATTAAQADIPDRCIKTLGRWKSDAYQKYIRTPPHELARLSQQLITSSCKPQSKESSCSANKILDKLQCL